MEAPKSKKKTYSIEDIRQLAPGYRGKPENFDPKKIGQKAKPKNQVTTWSKKCKLNCTNGIAEE
jgi:hypothetical protein